METLTLTKDDISILYGVLLLAKNDIKSYPALREKILTWLIKLPIESSILLLQIEE